MLVLRRRQFAWTFAITACVVILIIAVSCRARVRFTSSAWTSISLVGGAVVVRWPTSALPPNELEPLHRSYWSVEQRGWIWLGTCRTDLFFGWRRVFLPLWPFALLLSITSLAMFWASRKRAGRCQHCDFSLEGLNEPHCCPECGALLQASRSQPIGRSEGL
jgi:hypothetical protein